MDNPLLFIARDLSIAEFSLAMNLHFYLTPGVQWLHNFIQVWNQDFANFFLYRIMYPPIRRIVQKTSRFFSHSCALFSDQIRPFNLTLCLGNFKPLSVWKYPAFLVHNDAVAVISNDLMFVYTTRIFCVDMRKSNKIEARFHHGSILCNYMLLLSRKKLLNSRAFLTWHFSPFTLQRVQESNTSLGLIACHSLYRTISIMLGHGANTRSSAKASNAYNILRLHDTRHNEHMCWVSG